MALNKKAKELLEANTVVEPLAKEEFDRVLKESKVLSKKRKKEYNRITNKPILKQRLAQLYCSGNYNKRQIASMLMVSESTVIKLLKDPEVLDMVVSYQDEEKQLIDSRIKAIRFRAIDTIDELLDSDDDSIRLAVAKDILDRTGHKEKENKDININISYEQQLQELAQGIDYDIIEVE